jgi:hypothetical protein
LFDPEVLFSIEAMSATTESESTRTSFWRGSLLLAGCVLLGGLALAPFAIGKTGSSGLAGVALAGAICFAAGLLAEGVACLLGRQASPLATMLLGMTIRMLPPLAICMFLAAQGARGREHLAFIVYLLVFYLATLALETWLTVERVSRANASCKPSAFLKRIG